LQHAKDQKVSSFDGCQQVFPIAEGQIPFCDYYKDRNDPGEKPTLIPALGSCRPSNPAVAAIRGAEVDELQARLSFELALAEIANITGAAAGR